MNALVTSQPPRTPHKYRAKTNADLLSVATTDDSLVTGSEQECSQNAESCVNNKRSESLVAARAAKKSRNNMKKSKSPD